MIGLVILFQQNEICIGVTFRLLVLLFFFCKLTTVITNNFLSLYVGSENWPLTYTSVIILRKLFTSNLYPQNPVFIKLGGSKLYSNCV